MKTLIVTVVTATTLSFAACSTAGDALDDDHSHGAEGGTLATGGAAAGGAAGAPGGMGGVVANDGTVACSAPEACELVECQAENREGLHVDLCSPLTPHTNPVTSGPHYPYWAAFGVYEEPIPYGFLLHSLEHSAVALLYNCTLVEQGGASCSDLIDQLQAFYDAYPADPLCTDVPHRLIIAPSPELDVPFAATAWNYHLKGTCFDEARVSEFVADHYGKNYENICNSGIDPADAGCP